MEANNTTIEKETFFMPPSYPDGATEPNVLNALEKPERIQKIVQEGILLAGGAAAILLQVAMPGIYSGDDPQLQVWVAATPQAVGIDVYEQVFGRMSEEAAEDVYREYAILAVSLRVRPGMWPQDRRASWIYWNNVAKDLLFSNRVPLKIRAVLPLVRLMTADMLPDRIREEYGLKIGKCRRRMQGIVTGLTKAMYPATPKFIRTYPLRYYMKDMRRRTKDAK
ncbi:hypothetical protein ASPWEDRAFT_743188 [Aspergillus wentii DTO 134E9]|uniref:ER-bound oxygenase mpaB/mpaB'/Rubber oxygenase catalytic domain-containing protein n=1 Tax=Aspergillus wentii DTO 134E9 TaxID=1073089 RepID=A0A1L9RI79_ASPWE|nr:uncharacterized protein ASPWEDRAFT_743188 [Aspergillus wentii DTO 134E9]OJJ34568.1 hypothetical protein ASPWEDRAFT_743188 [Aspergillus wentii DTO 134E9]